MILPGKVTVLNVWASWCGPCRAELPQLDALHERLATDGVGGVIGLNVDEGRARAAALVDKLQLDLVVRYGGAEAAAALGPGAMPTTYVVGPDGIIRFVHVGALDEPAIRQIESEARTLTEAAR